MNSSDDETILNDENGDSGNVNGSSGQSGGKSDGSFGFGSVATNLPAGTRLGDYELEKLLGAGAMGEVYLARQVRLSQKCAIKILPQFLSKSVDFEKRFESEGRALAMLDHPHIVRVLNAGVGLERHFLTMEYVDGGSLEDYLVQRGGRLPESEVRVILAEILSGLVYAHEKNVVHRDLKPANILRTSDGHYKISDFGLALVAGEKYMQSMVRESIMASQLAGYGKAASLKTVKISDATIPQTELTYKASSSIEGVVKGSLSSEETLLESDSHSLDVPSHSSDAGSFVGTLDYMSPEIRDGCGEADARSDLYAVGVIAYQMLTGRKPRGRAKAVSAINRSISRKWDSWVDKCMEVDPADRFQSSDAAIASMPNGNFIHKRQVAVVITGVILIIAAFVCAFLLGVFDKDISGSIYAIDESTPPNDSVETTSSAPDETGVSSLSSGDTEPQKAVKESVLSRFSSLVSSESEKPADTQSHRSEDTERIEKLINQSALQRALDDVKQGRFAASRKELERLASVEDCAEGAKTAIEEAQSTISKADSVISNLPELIKTGRYADAGKSIRFLEPLHDYNQTYFDTAKQLKDLTDDAGSNLKKAKTFIQNGRCREALALASSLSGLSDYSKEAADLKTEAERADLCARAAITEAGLDMESGLFNAARHTLEPVVNLADYADETARLLKAISTAQADADGKLQQVNSLVKNGRYDEAQSWMLELAKFKDYEARANESLVSIQKAMDSLRGTLELRRNSSEVLNKAFYSLVTLGDEFWYVLKVDGVDMCKLEKVTQVKLKPGKHTISIVVRSFGKAATSDESAVLVDTVSILANRTTIYSFK